MNLDKLEAVARLADDGPWQLDLLAVTNAKGGTVASCWGTKGKYQLEEANATHIAAFNPQVAIKLIAVARLAKRVAFSEGFDAAYPEHLDSLRSALRELEQPSFPSSGTEGD